MKNALLNIFNDESDLYTPDGVNDPVDDCGRTRLHGAVWQQNADLVKQLLAQGADPLQCDNTGKSPFHYAAVRGDIDVFRMILDHVGIQNVNDHTTKDILGWTVLQEACVNGHFEITKMLLTLGVNPNQLDKNDICPMTQAAHKNHIGIMEILLKYGADIDKHLPPHSRSPLHAAIQQKNKETVLYLLKRGADPRKLDKQRLSPLWSAVAALDLEIVEIILNAAPDMVNVANRSLKRTPLHIAAMNTRVDIIEALLEAGANPQPVDEFGTTPLIDAARKNGGSAVKMLLEYGADINHVDERFQQTIFHHLHEMNNSKVVDMLLAVKGADINKQNVFGETPLHMAVGARRDSMVKQLLKAGADPGIPDNNGHLPIDIAKDKKSSIIVEILMKHARAQAPVPRPPGQGHS